MNVRCHFAAHTGPNPMRFAGINRHFDHPKDRGVRGVVKMGDAVVQAIDCDRILDQIIRPDAEKTDLTGEVVGDENRARDFDHDPHLDEGIEGDARGGEFLFALLEDLVGAAEFLDA